MKNSSQPSRSRYAALAVLCAAGFVASLDLFIVNVAFAAIGRDYRGASLSDLSWVLNAYAIVYAALLVPAGRLADRFGRRAAFLLGLALFTAASAGCAVAPSLWPLVASRVAQAAGAAILTPASLGLVLSAFPGPEGPRAVRIWAASGAIAAAAGPVVGGALVQASWRLVFLVNVPVGIVAVIAGLRLLTESRDPAATRLPDVLGASLLAVAIGAVSLGLVKGSEWGWTAPRTLASWIVAAASLVLVAWRSARHAVPVIEPALLRVRSFAWSNAAAVAFSAAFAANLLLVVLWLQHAWHWSAIQTGLGVAPGPLMVPAFTAVAHRLHRRLGSGGLIAAGCLLFCGGVMLTVTSLAVAPSYPSDILPGLIVGGAGVGLALPEIMSASTTTLPQERTSTGSAIVNMSRQIGAVVGVSIVVAILATPVTPLQALDHFRAAWWSVVAAGAAGAILALGMTPRAGAGRTQIGVVEGPA